MAASRKYDRNAHRRRFKKGSLTYRGKGSKRGSGHQAGFDWAGEKEIDPKSRVTKYSKNSPSFDEGVWTYKENVKGKPTNYWWQQFSMQFHLQNPHDATNRELLRMLMDHHRQVRELSDDEYDSVVGQLQAAVERGEINFEQAANFVSQNKERPPPAPGQMSEADWWAAQFDDVARLKVGGHRRLGPVKKESYLRAEMSKHYTAPHTEEEKRQARTSHGISKAKDEPPKKKKKKKGGHADQPRDGAGKFTEASANVEHNPKTGLSEVKPWTPKGAAQLSHDQDWWNKQFAEPLQFIASDRLNQLGRPPTGQHKQPPPKPPPDRATRRARAFAPAIGLLRRLIGSGMTEDEAKRQLSQGEVKSRQSKNRRQRWSPRDLKPAPKPPPKPGQVLPQKDFAAMPQLSEDAMALLAEFRAERDPQRRRSLAEQAKLQFEEGDDAMHYYPHGREWGTFDPAEGWQHGRGSDLDIDVGRKDFAPQSRQAVYESMGPHELLHLMADRLEGGEDVDDEEIQSLVNHAHTAPSNMTGNPSGQALRARVQEAMSRLQAAYARRRSAQMSESPSDYQGRLVAQYPSLYQPIQFGEQPPNLMHAEHQGTSCASCKHFKPSGGKEVDDQGRCKLYDYVVKARMTCDAWTPTKEQQDFRGPGVNLDREGGDSEHGGTSQLSEPLQFIASAGGGGGYAFQRPMRAGSYGPPGQHKDDPQPDQREDVDRGMERERGFWKRLKEAFGVKDEDVIGEGEKRRAYADEQRKKRKNGGGGGGGYSWEKPRGIRQRMPQQPHMGVPQGRQLWQQPQIAAMSESDAEHFAGYEAHLLATMPERYQ